MRILYVVASLAVLCLHHAECDQLRDNVSLETRLRWIERRLQNGELLQEGHSQRLSDLESLMKTGKVVSAEGVSVDFKNRLGDMEKDINVFKDTIKRLARRSAKEKIQVKQTVSELRNILNDQGHDIGALQQRLETFLDLYKDDKDSNTRELNAQLLEAVGILNATFVKFRKDILSRDEVLVTELPTPTRLDLLPREEVLVTEPPTPKQSCQPKWVHLENLCYLLVDDYIPWYSASRDCQNRGGKLAEPKTSELHDRLYDTLSDKLDKSAVWIGGTDEEREGVWVWSQTNETIGYSKWIPGQPDNRGGKADCFAMWNKTWFDDDCALHFNYLCEKSMF